ncbi:EAL domain-containing protein [Nitrosomonas ureae]|uniref:PAS domain S-box-containing protein/diguanylate cyclase (GGDEF) domain-containing protein n=1 Tax=Nitrosomonas ureae TaxID=44577 RepID=A0A1H8ZG84_9PROT|nr:EAL domain-containing protein [Nitrosomonas ureae]SEP63247.1 PAS domain S-box-containing protein/diguanylate cyclase (GGDEF) domain-containing protein [Nitrosomonas ureae]
MIQWVDRAFRNTFFLRAILLITSVGLLSFFAVLERIDAVIYDQISTIQHYSPDDDIVIVAIDEESIKTLGRWPWSRSVHAELIKRLESIGNPAVAFDLIFSEPQANDPDADHSLASAIASHGRVILPVVPVDDKNRDYVYLVEPLPIYRQHAQLGHVDIELDSDGIARRVFLTAGIEEPEWPAFALVLAASTHQYTINSMNSFSDDKVKFWGRWVRSHEVLIPYVGKTGSFQQVSYAQVLLDDRVLVSLRNKFILVGMTATGIGTRFATPVSPLNRQPMSGVEWHANVLSMLLHNRAILPISHYSTSLISVAWVLAILFLFSIFSRNITMPLLLVLIGCGLCAIWIVLRFLHIWFPPGAALVGTIAIYPLLNWQRINEYMRSLFVAKAGSNAALESVGDGVITTDAHNHIIYMNKGAERILGVALEQAQGVSLLKLMKLSKIHDSVIFNELIDSEIPLPISGIDTIQCYLKTSSGEKRAVRITRRMLRDEHEALMGFLFALADITDTIELTKQVAYQASYDTLTNLPNRALLLTRFKEMTSLPEKYGKIIAVFFVSLDNFKKINDALGHRAGDELIRMVSQRLNSIISNTNFLARWGGDEFVLLFSDLHDKDRASQRAQETLDLIEHQFLLHGQEVFVTVSIGISFFSKDGNDNEVVLERASTAMHRIKNEGGNSFGFYSMESSVAWTRDRLKLEKELRIALNSGHLQVLYQPIVDVYQQNIVRMEALVRWPHPTRGYLSPSEFIPLAESIGLMEQLGKEVLKIACLAAHKLIQIGKPIHVSVNVHPHQLLHGNFLPALSRVLTETGLPATSLILEITESAVVSDMARASVILQQIKTLGALIALDDFGTGYSSLTLLRELPIDILKIDKSFIRALDQNINDLTITQAIIGLGVNLGLMIVAEGVESDRQARILLENHCYLQQGYFFSRPVPYESILQLVNEADLSNLASIKQLCAIVNLK